MTVLATRLPREGRFTLADILVYLNRPLALHCARVTMRFIKNLLADPKGSSL